MNLQETTFDEKKRKLEAIFRSLGRVVIGFSGGVDSTAALKAATLAIGRENALGVTAISESTTPEDLEICRRIALEHGLEHREIRYSELAIPNYAKNPANRCYFCKGELFDRLREIAREFGGATVCDGSNVDDAADYRPGLRAKEERGVRSPLREAGFAKEDVRRLARELGLPNHDRPSAPCLSSRIPYGMEVTREKLDQVAEAERFVRSLGFRQVRCRHHGSLARIEVEEEGLERAFEHRKILTARLKELGFRYVALDLQGFRSGSLNEVLPAAQRAAGQGPVGQGATEKGETDNSEAESY